MTHSNDHGTHDPPERPAYRAPVGMPTRDDGRRAGAIVSFLLHALIFAMIGLPFVFSRTIINRIEQGAGGPGRAGGGGGGRGGNEGSHESLQFVKLVQQQVPTPTKVPVTPPVVPKPQPVPPPVTLPPTPQVKTPEATPVPTPAPTQAVSSTAGEGPGIGHDGSNGNGPGSGGGVGSGIGAGRGSGNGPGTGGGTQANYPPFPIEFFLPPLPPPASVRGFHFIAEFDVDSTGKVLDFKFSETRDGDYNRRIASILRSMRFRPGTRPDGTPLRMKAQVEYGF